MPKARFEDLVEVMHRLYAPGGCPWDREQTFETLRQYILEEAYEVVDAIESGAHEKVADEAGDLLFQVVFLAEIAREKGWFEVEDVIGGIRKKLIDRHPHVFGEKAGREEAPGEGLTAVKDAGDVITNWESIKAKEREKGGAKSAIDGVPPALPAMVRAEKIGKRAARSGFDWRSIDAVLDKVGEELGEIRGALAAGDKKAAGEELGDLLFAAAQVARMLEVNPEDAARGAVRTFEKRFRHLEAALAAQGRTPKDADDAELDRLWEAAKKALAQS
jgi:MazG family protein